MGNNPICIPAGKLSSRDSLPIGITYVVAFST